MELVKWAGTPMGSLLRIVICPFLTLLLPITLFTPAAVCSSLCARTCDYIASYRQADCTGLSLTRVPGECSGASYLSLQDNAIASMAPGTFGAFSALQYLVLSNNRISHLEGNTFSGTLQLKSIKFLYNDMRTIDHSAFNGTGRHFRKVYLSRNIIERIEDGTFQRAPHLQFIDLYNNSLSEVTSGTFRGMRNLNRLFLGMNRIADLKADVFTDLTALVYLDLSNNSLAYLNNGLFRHLAQLKTIDLSGNQLLSISMLQFRSISRVDLRWNNLTEIGDVTDEDLDRVEVLYLEYNLWYCDSRLEALRLWFRSVSHDKSVDVDSPSCVGPPELRNISIKLIDHPLPAMTTTRVTLPVESTTKLERLLSAQRVPESAHQMNDQASETPVKVPVVIATTCIIIVIIVVISLVLYKKKILCSKFRQGKSPSKVRPSDKESTLYDKTITKEVHTKENFLTSTPIRKEENLWQRTEPRSCETNKLAHIIVNLLASTPVREEESLRQRTTPRSWKKKLLGKSPSKVRPSDGHKTENFSTMNTPLRDRESIRQRTPPKSSKKLSF